MTYTSSAYSFLTISGSSVTCALTSAGKTLQIFSVGDSGTNTTVELQDTYCCQDVSYNGTFTTNSYNVTILKYFGLWEDKFTL